MVHDETSEVAPGKDRCLLSPASIAAILENLGLAFPIRGGYDLQGGHPIHRYRDEVGNLRSTKDITRHIARWQMLWEYDPDAIDAVNMLHQELRAGAINKTRTLACIRKLRNKKDCPHSGRYDSPCPGILIVAPWVLVFASLNENYFKVPFDVALHQTYCSGPHDHCF